MHISVVIATIGRAPVTRRTVKHLERQTRLADRTLIVAVEPGDVAGVESTVPAFEIAFAEKGLCKQRNHSLKVLGKTTDVIVYLDDDFVPCDDFLENLEALFAADETLVGVTGHVIADGVRGVGIGFDEALALTAAWRRETSGAQAKPRESLYGCNMAVRVSALDGLSFDERLPNYGWLEDVDLTYQLGQRGKLIESPMVAGVHMGSKAARSPGKRLGYSQIANPVYLLRKKTIPPVLARRLMLRNATANLMRSFYPEPYVDRRGRLWGNLVALKDLVTGRIDPMRITEFR